MQNFNNQYNFRVDNQIKLINLLKNGQQSINYLADKLNLSFTAVSKIVEQLISYDVLKKVNIKNQAKKRGRLPVLVKINTSVGVTCSVDLSSTDLIVSLNSLTEKVIVSKKIPNVLFVTEDTLKTISEVINELLKAPEVEKRPLLGICIASPGVINKDTEQLHLAFRLQSLVSTPVTTYFFNKFNVPVHMYNDVKTACIGEMVYGSIPQNAKNYVFIHVGGSVGAAMVFGGKLYQGKSGYSGEFTNYIEEAGGATARNRILGFWAIEDYIQKHDPNTAIDPHGDSTANLEILVREYKNNNPVVLEAIDMLAKQNAIQFIAYNDFLDLEYIVIEGSVSLLKEKYQESLIKYINELDLAPFDAKILFSSLNGKATHIGSIYCATRNYFLQRLEEITIDRSSTGNYDISEAFSDTI